ncbi:lectin protein kinase family protein [Prunus dulcis]|uniref:Lectin protein kinase family protein n=1 Tax=Prunus dulcis TaxID=3755 RepID=A0A4Y1RNE5_PRUDU|nr:lectin protein kinase family protein [Prunus dulcis]
MKEPNKISYSFTIAKDIFAIPSFTVASENAFSLGKRIVDPFRSSFHPKMVEAFVCTSDWLRVDEFSFYKEPTDDEIALVLKQHNGVLQIHSPPTLEFVTLVVNA